MSDDATKEKADALKAEGNELLRAGDLDGAIAAYTKAIGVLENQVYYSNRANAYTQQQRYDLALQDAERCIELKPDWSRGYSRKGNALFFLGRYEDAAKAYLEGLKVDPTNQTFQQEFQRSSLMAQAAPFLAADWKGKLLASALTNQLMQNAEFVTKIEGIRANPAQLPSLLNVDEEVTRAYIVLAGKEQEVRAQQDAERKRQAEAEAKRRADSRARKEKAAKEAEQAAFDALSQEEKDALVAKDAGNAAYKAKKFDEAIEHYQKALTLTPNNILLYTNQASVRMAQERFEDAVELCDQAVAKGKEVFADYTAMAKALERKGRALYRLKRYADALQALDEAILNNRTGNCVRFRNQVAKAKKKQDDEAYLDPELAAKAKAEGNEYFKKHEWGEAIRCYREAIKRDPTNHVFYSNLAQTYFKVRENQLALEAATKCVELNPKFLKGIARKAHAQYLLKEYYKALATYEQGLEIDPEYADFKEGVQRVTYAISSMRTRQGGEGGDAEEARQRAMADPKIQQTLQDPEVQNLIRTLQQGDQQQAQRMLMGSQALMEKYKLLSQAGLM